MECLLTGDTQEMKHFVGITDAAPKYYSKQQGEYTLEDYYALPEDVRAELIDGDHHTMVQPIHLPKR